MEENKKNISGRPSKEHTHTQVGSFSLADTHKKRMLDIPVADPLRFRARPLQKTTKAARTAASNQSETGLGSSTVLSSVQKTSDVPVDHKKKGLGQ